MYLYEFNCSSLSQEDCQKFRDKIEPFTWNGIFDKPPFPSFVFQATLTSKIEDCKITIPTGITVHRL